MAEFQFTYAYDVPCFVDFKVIADTKEEAEVIARKAFLTGQFANVEPEPNFENEPIDMRVFSPLEEDEDPSYTECLPTMEELIEQSKPDQKDDL